ncbi:hypothetical protein RHMOL_Rhmol08G0300600 [Rhododendron molle]|uniref:Uncharacterized protein n=1 Tax=Rhododendron molle TaxID=49168 RepID=A0ACC0MW11_RHOML|nr:hypothetical protein RHMOL_Rhmol08G0300600 [Rhododendron molle]
MIHLILSRRLHSALLDGDLAKRPKPKGGSSRDNRCSHTFDRLYRLPGPPPSGVHDLLYRIPCSPEPDNFLEKGAFEYAMSQEAAKYVNGSLVSINFYEGGELLKEFSGSGFVIRSDGIIATSANLLRPLQGKECEIIVRFSNSSGSYKGALLHADFCSNIALIKIMPGQRLAVATFGKLDSMCPEKWVTVAGSKPPDYMWSDSVFNFDLGNFSHLDHVDNKIDSTESRNVRTSGQLIKADCKSRRTSVGGALVSINGVIFGEGGINYGVIGVVHTVSGPLIEATPIDEVLKYLEQFENNSDHRYAPKVVICQSGHSIGSLLRCCHGSRIIKNFALFPTLHAHIIPDEEVCFYLD